MTLLNFELQRGAPIVEQVLLAARRAIVRGDYLEGQPFPSVRALAASLKIHPNTAHKAVQQLIEERWLENRPGIGTLVAARRHVADVAGRARVSAAIDGLVVTARAEAVPLAEVLDETRERWNQDPPPHRE